MRQWQMAVAAAAMCVSGAMVTTLRAADDPTDPAAPAGWKLTWSDEFNGDSIDRTKWGFETGNRNGFGNHEKEFYTDQPQNASVRDGALHIVARKEPHDGFDYTSARMLTKGKFSQKFGRFDFRAKLPTGAGLWPALWLLPQDEVYGGWPLSGEIDVTEARGQRPTQVLGTIHYGNAWPHNQHSGETYTLPNNGSIADWHLYTLEWEPGVIRWYIDGQLYSTKTKWFSAKKDGTGNNSWPAPFDQAFFLIFNVAVGGDFLKGPDDTTKFPQEMTVDYVRVYEKEGGYAPATQPATP